MTQLAGCSAGSSIDQSPSSRWLRASGHQPCRAVGGEVSGLGPPAVPCRLWPTTRPPRRARPVSRTFTGSGMLRDMARRPRLARAWRPASAADPARGTAARPGRRQLSRSAREARWNGSRGFFRRPRPGTSLAGAWPPRRLAPAMSSAWVQGGKPTGDHWTAPARENAPRAALAEPASKQGRWFHRCT